MERVAVADVAAVVDTAKMAAPCVLTRCDLPSGAAVSFVYDGDEEIRDSCQWRVFSEDVRELRGIVEELVSHLARSGVRYREPRFAQSVCRIQDLGPWRIQR